MRAAPEVFGPVASDPTVSRLIDALAGDAPAALAAIAAPRAAARARAWQLAGEHAPDRAIDAARPLVIDVDATLVTAHSEKECAAPTVKRGFGFHPLWAFVDHGAEGTGEPLSVLLRAGNAGSGPPRADRGGRFLVGRLSVVPAGRQEQPPRQRTGGDIGHRADAHPDLAVADLAQRAGVLP